MSTTTSDQITTDVNDSQRLGERVRSRLPVALTAFEERAKTQWVALPNAMRGAVDQLIARVRNTLDIPSRGEIAVLLERIETIDAKLSSMEQARVKAKPKARAAAAKPKATAKKPAASKTARRTRIESAAKKRKPKKS